MKVDLAENFNVSKVNPWHYSACARTYYDVMVQFSNVSDFSRGVITVYNNDTDNSSLQGAGMDTEYVETSAGKK